MQCSEAWAAEKLQRRHAWLELRAVARALDSTHPDWARKSRLTESLRNIMHDPTRNICRTGGGLGVVQPDGTYRMCIPLEFEPGHVMFIGHHLDRGSTGCSAVSFVLGQHDTFWHAHWGIMHDGWNVVRNGCRKAAGGSVWRCVIITASIGNLPHGPLRTGAWGRYMVEVHARLCTTEEMSGRRLEVAVRLQAEMEPFTDMNGAQWYRRWITLSITTGSVGTVLKFSRWYSVSQRWREIRPIYWFEWVVCDEMAVEQGAGAVLDSGATDLWDSSISAVKSGSRLKATHTYFSREHVMGMDCYAMATEYLATSHYNRVKAHLSVDDHFADLHDRQGGWWADEAQDIITSALVTPDRQMFAFSIPHGEPHEAANQYANRLCVLTLNILAGWIIRTLHLAGSYPELAVQVLVKGNEQRAVGKVAQHCKYLVWAEAEARRSPLVAAVLRDIPWLQYPVVRLILHLCHQDHHEKRHDRSVQVARRVGGRLPDERVPEDCHQKVRDAQRCLRRNTIGTNGVFAQCLKSGLLEARSVTTLEVPSQQLAEAKFVRQSRPRTHDEFVPRSWPKQWNALMDAHKGFPTISPQGSFSACLSWNLLAELVGRKRGGTLGKTWPSRLLTEISAWRDKTEGAVYLVVAVGQFAAVAVPLEENQDNPALFSVAKCFKSVRKVMDAVFAVDQVRDFGRMHFRGVRRGMHVEIHEVEGPTTGLDPLQCALMARRSFSTWEVEMTITQLLGKEVEAGSSFQSRLELIVNETFDEPEKRSTVLALYARPATEAPVEGDEEEELDEDTRRLIADLAEDEIDNAGDLKRYVAEVGQEVLKKLGRKRAATRAAINSRRVKLRAQRGRRKRLSKGKCVKRAQSKKRAAGAAAAGAPAASAGSADGAPAPKARRRQQPQAQAPPAPAEAPPAGPPQPEPTPAEGAPGSSSPGGDLAPAALDGAPPDAGAALARQSAFSQPPPPPPPPAGGLPPRRPREGGVNGWKAMPDRCERQLRVFFRRLSYDSTQSGRFY